MTDLRFLRTTWFLAVLLVVGAALFAVGVAAERNSGDQHSESPATVTTVHNETSNPGAEGGSEGGNESTPHVEGSSSEASGHSESSEKILGINTESTGLVAVTVLLSLALALLAIARPRRPIFLVVVAFAGAFAVFDVVEAIHQINNSRPGIAAIAILLTLAHAAAALLAMQHAAPDSTAAA